MLVFHQSSLGGLIYLAPTTGLNPQPASTSTAPGSSLPVSVPPPSMLRGKTIEEIVNKWSTELETHVREFNKFASEVAVWDRSLIENGNNVRIISVILLPPD